MEKKTTETASSRGKRLKVTGRVTSDKMDKTATVKVERRVRHPRFGKFVARYTTCKVHDEKNEAREGDFVEIVETRPLSATKRWRLLRIVRAAAGAHDAPADAAEGKA